MISLGFYVASVQKQSKDTKVSDDYWFVLHRKSNVELLYKGKPGAESKSRLIRAFHVKAGVPGERPTPLPQVLGKKYWVITKKFDTSDNFETAPYFLELNIPAPSIPPYGPSPYLECDGPAGERGEQCDWGIPGSFGLHGVAGDLTRLDSDNVGSSGCIRHADEDITYLYKLLDPKDTEIRYYIQDI